MKLKVFLKNIKKAIFCLSDMVENRDSIFMRERAKNSIEKVTCIFLIHNLEAFDSIIDVYISMEKNPNFLPIVISVPKFFPGAKEFYGEEYISQKLTAMDIKHIRFKKNQAHTYLKTIHSLNPDIIFRQSQWENDVPSQLSNANLCYYKLCLVPYEAMTLIEDSQLDKNGQSLILDNMYHRLCWKVFCANPIIKNLAKNLSPLQGEQYVVTGHPKLDRIKNAQPIWPIHQERSQKAFRIIWCAHHSTGNNWMKFGLFPSVATLFLEWAKHNSNIEFVFAPHPALKNEIAHAKTRFFKRKYKYFIDQWNKLENTHIFEGGHYGALFQASDLLVIDGISWLLEYQIVEKPVVFLERKDHLDFNEVGKIMLDGVYPVHNFLEMKNTVEAFQNGAEHIKKETQKQIVEKLFGSMGAAQRIVEDIQKSLKP